MEWIGRRSREAEGRWGVGLGGEEREQTEVGYEIKERIEKKNYK